MNDLLERLRDEPRPFEMKNGLGPPAMEMWHQTCLEAADEIEQLRTALEKIATGRGTGCSETENAAIMRQIAKDGLKNECL